MALLTPDCAIVVQRLADPTIAARAVANARFLAEASLPGPTAIGAARGRFVAWERSSGTPGPLLLGGPAGDRLAHDMGRLARELGRLPAKDLAVDPPWRSPEALRRAAGGWLERLAAEEGNVLERRDQVRNCIERVCEGTWSPRPTHGDFVPANVLVNHGHIEALLDIAGLALRHPDVDMAWWELVVGYHHPRDAARLTRSFRRGHGAGVSRRSPGRRDVAVLRALQLVPEGPGRARAHALALLSAAVAARG